MSKLSYHKISGPVGYRFTAVNTGSWRIERPVVDESRCVKCGTCEKYCPCAVIKVEKEKPLAINMDFCKGCGICANECPVKCISMIPEEEFADVNI